MKKQNQTFLHALKLWLIWNVLVDLSLVILVGFTIITILPLSQELGYSPDSEIFPVIMLGFLVGSLFAGLIQWPAFIHRIKQSYDWIFATALGYSLAIIILFLLLRFIYWVIDKYLADFEFSTVIDFGIITLGLAIFGAVSGLIQWLILRGKVSESGCWLLGSVLGWACAGCAAFVLWQTGMREVGALVGLSFMGMITGVAYAYLFSQPVQKRSSNEGALRPT